MTRTGKPASVRLSAGDGLAMELADAFKLASQRCARLNAWCQGSSARDQFGRDVRDTNCVPVSRWVLGHFADVCGERSNGGDLWTEGFALAATEMNEAPTAWNDAEGRTQIEAVEMLRSLSALAQGPSS